MMRSSALARTMALAWLAGAWIAGIAAAGAFGASAWPLGAAAGVAGVAAALWRRDLAFACVALLLPVVFVAAIARYDAARSSPDEGGVAAYNGAVAMRIRAVLRDDPELRDTSQRFAVSVRAVQRDGAWAPLAGGVLITTDLLATYRSGDVLELEGRVEAPPVLDGFDYADYLARRNITSVMGFPKASLVGHEDDSLVRATILHIRRTLSRSLDLALPEPQSSLAQGVLLGRRSALPRDLAADLNTTNTSHLVVVSGSNIVLVAAFASMLCTWLIGRRPALVVSAGAVLAYAAVIGPSPPVVRAVIMGLLLILASGIGRRSSAAVLILAAAAVMLAFDPRALRDDVSFQLTFAATAGVLYLAPPLRRAAIAAVATVLRVPEVPRVVDRIAEPLAMTLAAVLVTAPLLAMEFGRASLIAIPANLLIVPAFPLIVATTLLAALGGLLPEYRLIFAAPAYYTLTYWIVLSRWLAALPGASANVPSYTGAWAAVTYAALAAAAAALARWHRGTPQGVRLAPARPMHPRALLRLAAVGLPVVATLAGMAFVAWPARQPQLQVTVLDVGQGDAILIRTPAGADVLIDGGPGGAVLRGLGEGLPFSDRSLELVVLTHPATDHLLGLVPVLDRYDVRRVIAGPGVATPSLARAWRTAGAAEGTPVEVARQGARYDLGDGVMLEVLGPDPSQASSDQVNDTSAVLRLSWRDVSFLFTGDIGPGAEQALLRDGVDLRSTVLKVPHHGSKTSSTRAFLDAVMPSVSIVSVGAGNPFGQPAPDTIDRLRRYGSVYTTADSGAVTLTTTGRTISISTQR